MRSNIYKQIVKDLQRHKAQLDYALGKPPRKNSKTYTEAYAHEYEQGEKDTALSAMLEEAYF